MKSQSIERLLRDLLHITTRESDKLSEILAENFDFLNEQIVKILREEYQKPKNDYRVLCGCFSVIEKAFQKYPRIGSKNLQNSYPLMNRGLLDKRKSVKRFAVLCVLTIICKVYLEKRFQKLSRNGDNGKDIDAEIEELKKNIKSKVFLESFNSTQPRQLDRRIACEMAGIKEEVLVKVATSVLG
jgi:archaellum component FlaC